MVELNAICSSTVQLQCLVVKHASWNNPEEITLPLLNIKRLVLHLKGEPVSLREMNQLMLNLPDLQHFELVTKGLLDMTDGQSWEKMTRSLLTFNFNISAYMDWIEDIIQSFRTSFWLEEKQWFVACTWDSLYSVPYFSDICANTYFRPPLYSSVTDEALFCDHINHFILNESPKQTRYYFRHIKKLEIA
ncbi:unnamed protein product, partial [Rotaria magnacalcarata]